jgi:hypothetical protein
VWLQLPRHNAGGVREAGFVHCKRMITIGLQLHEKV